jgi:hypothetical protein
MQLVCIQCDQPVGARHRAGCDAEHEIVNTANCTCIEPKPTYRSAFRGIGDLMRYQYRGEQWFVSVSGRWAWSPWLLGLSEDEGDARLRANGWSPVGS